MDYFQRQVNDLYLHKFKSNLTLKEVINIYSNIIIVLNVLKGDKWKKNRKVISPAFNQRILNDFVPILTRHATTLEGILLKNVDKNIDITYYAGKCIVDIVCGKEVHLK